MIGLVVRRLLALVPVALIVGTITFTLLHVAPGDPAAVMLGSEATPEQVARARERLGLDDPLLVQYPRWLLGILRLDFGDSLFLDRPVATAIAGRIVPTLQLTLYAMVIALVIGVPAGVIAAVRQNSLIDRLLMLLAVAGTAIADFFLAILLVLLFAVTLRWLPSGGYVPLLDSPIDHARSMVLPAFALGLSIAGLPARLIRASLLDVLQEDYVRAAIARGLSPATVVVRHALRNALLPAVTVLGYTLGDLLGGAVVVETVFNLPGMGQLVVNSIARRDFPVIQGVVMAIAGCYLLANLLVDVLYMVIDPRIRHGHVSR
ncbi:MAG TPA: ABC transporter permease [Thermomicrobiales bacterium]|nr:ABC transporter permease [Thermomicrobiales bacterium]